MIYQKKRDEIYSLRAIAVLGVVIFHLDKNLLPQGYIGVDIFFVISGYLITRSVLTSIQNNSFDLKKFFIRRAARILPALLVVLLIVFLLSYFFLLTGDLKRLSNSLISSLSYVANFYFFYIGGYFSTNDELKPLLHLWSLSTEEQFYLIIPFFLIFILKIVKKINLSIILICSIIFISFFLSLYLKYYGYSNLNFFLLPFRIWEFFVGVLFAFLKQVKIKNHILESCYIIFSISLIFLNYTYVISFLPSATLAVFGSGLFLYLDPKKKNLVIDLFSNKILIFFGLISYSLYLIHWPVISLLKYAEFDITFYFKFLLTLVFVLLSFLSWKYIEKPFLDKKVNTINFIKFIFIFYFLLFALSFLAIKYNLPNRFNNFENNVSNSVDSNYRCKFYNYIKLNDNLGCYLNKVSGKEPTVALVGNSYGLMFGHPINKILIDLKLTGIALPFRNCYFSFLEFNKNKLCIKIADKYLTKLNNNKNIKVVIIGMTWNDLNFVNTLGNVYLDDDNKIKFNSLKKVIKSLNNSGKDVYFLGPIPDTKMDYASFLSRKIAYNKDTSLKDKTSSREEFLIKNSNILSFLEKEFKDRLLRVDNYFCDLSKCYYSDDQNSFYSDNIHLSKYGSLKTLNLFNFLSFYKK